MANTFRLKRSAVASKVPTTGDLQLGELALNTFDGRLYTLKDNGTPSVVRLSGVTETALTFNNAGSGAASGTSFDGSTARTISYNSIGAPSTTGANASGTWGISITGNAATVTNGVYQNGYGSFQASFTSNIDANVNRNAGVYGSYSNGATNTPTTAGILWNATSGTTGQNDGGQIWQDYVSNNLYVRQRWGGNWSASWLPILSSTNFNTYAPTKTGTGASGTWGISVTGSAAQLNGISSTGLFNNMGETHSARQSFDATTASYDFGLRYVQGSTNGPGTGGSQFYSAYVGLGSQYPATGASSHGMYLAIDRYSTSPYLSVRYNENNSLGPWYRICAGKADTLTTARTINGTSFNGSANITTANWGTSRTLTIGSTGKAVDGSGNVSWSLAEIGAPSTTGTGASGTWGISITGSSASCTGNAATATDVDDGTY